MTATPSVSRATTENILRHWQAEAVRRWKHIDPALLAVEGALWKAMLHVLTALYGEPGAAKPLAGEKRNAILSQNVSVVQGQTQLADRAQAQPVSDGQAAKDGAERNASGFSGTASFALLDAPIRRCAEQLAALPVAWLDLRDMLRELAAQTRRAAEEKRAEQTDGGDGAIPNATFLDGAMEALAACTADLLITRLEQQIALQQEQTLATQHLAERFLGNASHELRTPLTAILGFAELLLEETYGELTPQQATTVGYIENSAQNLNEIVSNMLDLLHIRAGKLALQYRPVSVAGLLQHLYQILTPLAGRKNVQFLIQVADDVGLVELDENIVRHIVYHLLSSALRATPAGGEVILRARREAPHLILEALDTALHLPPEAIANMADPFPRLENLPTRGYEGWEVGLPLVRRYVELHRGQLRTESLPEHGTVFTVLLPLMRPRDAKQA